MFADCFEHGLKLRKKRQREFSRTLRLASRPGNEKSARIEIDATYIWRLEMKKGELAFAFS
jgi:hypothetical protein